jgi:hypothetical protein
MSAALRSPAARFGIPGLVLGLCLPWVVSGGRFPSRAAAATPQAEASGTVVVTSNSPRGDQILYLIDTKNQAFAVYRVDPQNPKGAVKLEAARQYRWDLRLAEFNNLPPDVAAIESMVGNSSRR